MTLSELKKKLEEYPDDYEISENCLNSIHECVKWNDIKDKSLHLTLDVTVPMDAIVGENPDELLEFLSEYTGPTACGITEWMDYMLDDYLGEFKAELV